MKVIYKETIDKYFYLQAILNHFGGSDLVFLKKLTLRCKNIFEKRALLALIAMRENGIVFSEVKEARPFLVYDISGVTQVNTHVYLDRINEKYSKNSFVSRIFKRLSEGLFARKLGEMESFFDSWRIIEAEGKEYFVRIMESREEIRPEYADFTRRIAKWALSTAVPLIIYASDKHIQLSRKNVIEFESLLKDKKGSFNFNDIDKYIARVRKLHEACC